MVTTSPGRDRRTQTAIAFIGVLLLAGVLAVGVIRLAGYEPEGISQGSAVSSARLGFVDLGAGVVRIYDWERGIELQTLAPGEGSFVRGVLRSMVRERRSRGLLTDDPFTLSQYADGSLILEDPLTDRRIELWAFGPSNAGVFAALLAASQGAS
jgi:putative photosynthetic complex assembly protein